MTIRTWVAWNKNRTLTYALPTFFIFVWVGGFATVGEVYNVSNQCSFFGLWLLTASLMLFFSVDPSPRTQYVCHSTRSDPIIFLSRVIIPLYDIGVVVIYPTTQSRMC